MFAILLSACAVEEAEAPPSRPTLGAAVPLSGPDADLGRAALDAIAIAAGPDVAVLPVDDTTPGAAAALAANPLVFGVVAHVRRATAEEQALSWTGTDLPVVVAAPGDFRGLPRVVPPIDTSARCATTFLDSDFWVRTDGSTPGMVAGRTLVDAHPEHALGVDTVDATHVAAQAAKLAGSATRPVAWTGDAAAGGNFLRALRQVGSDAPFLGVGLYDTRFLQAAGSLAEGARVTSASRPAQARGFLDAYAARTGEAPLGPAVDAYEAAVLLVSAWRAASASTRAAGAPLLRADVATALRTVVADGANGPMYLGPDDVLQPVLCASFVVQGGAFVGERVASEADALLAPAEPKPRR